MRYEIVFCVPQEFSGEATYMAKRFNSITAPYQYERPNDFRAQQFIFLDLLSLNQFLKSAREKYGSKFIIESIENLTYKEKIGKGG